MNTGPDVLSGYVDIAGHPAMVIASVLIAVLAMYVALDLAGRVHRADDRAGARLWTAAGSLAMGSGIWATHFVGMAAAVYPFQARYEASTTLASWIIAVLTSAIVLDVAGRKTLAPVEFACRSILAGCGAALMHYVGVEAMAVSRAPIHDVLLVAVAVVAMSLGSFVALWLFAGLRDLEGLARVRKQLAAAAIYGSTLASMHYIGMASTSFDPDTVGTGATSLDVVLLGDVVAFAAIVFLAVVLMMTTLERQSQTRAKRLHGSLDEVRKELRHVTFNDPVTGLPNRLVFQDRLRQAVARSDRNGEMLAILFIDIDGFKTLDHSWTDAGGDDMLRHISASLVSSARASDTVANVGGDQFPVMMDAVGSMQPAIALAERIALNLKRGEAGFGRKHVTASIGITLYPADGDAATLVGNASSAALAAQRNGGNGYCFFEAKMNAEAHARSEWLDDLRVAQERGELELFYQPKVRALTGRVAGVEALLRWRHPTRGLVGPNIFIPLAEQFGLINAFGAWVVEDACRQMRAWQDAGIGLQVSINLSVHQLRQPRLTHEIADALSRHGVDPAHLICEITESVAMEDSQTTLPVLERLRDVGVQLSIDDFGTGYSSLSYLRKLPVSQLKIDQSFVRDLEKSDDARAIVEAIINLAHVLRLEVVAEGVETEAQRRTLLELRCDEFQGYLFARPVAACDLQIRLAERTAADEIGKPLLVAA